MSPLIKSSCDQVTVLWGTKFALLEFWANESVGTHAAAAVCSKVLLDWMVMLQSPFSSCFVMRPVAVRSWSYILRTWTCFDWEPVWSYPVHEACVSHICSNSCWQQMQMLQRGCRLLWICIWAHHQKFLWFRLYSFLSLAARVWIEGLMTYKSLMSISFSIWNDWRTPWRLIAPQCFL